MLKRGQAAMEFLMTYGWAILAVLISIAALAYFGVLNPLLFLPESCTLFPGVACTDFRVTSGYAILKIQNGLGENLDDFRITIQDCNGTASSKDGSLRNGESQFIATGCTIKKNRLNSEIDISYIKGGLTHTRKGKIVTRVSTTSPSGTSDYSEVKDGCSYSMLYNPCPGPCVTTPSGPDINLGLCQGQTCFEACTTGGADFQFNLPSAGNYIAVARIADYKVPDAPISCPNIAPVGYRSNFKLFLDGIDQGLWLGGYSTKWAYATMPFTTATPGLHILRYNLLHDCYCQQATDPNCPAVSMDMNLHIDDITVFKV